MAEDHPRNSNLVDVKAINVEGQEQYRQFVANRVQKFARTLNFNASSLGKALGLPTSTASNYWNGKKAWPIEIIPFVAAALRTTVAELLSSNGLKSQKLPVHAIAADLRPADAQVDTVAIPMLELGYGMGGTFLDDGDPGANVEAFPSAFIRKFTRTPGELLAWADGIGDSMYPTIGDRDLLLIDRSNNSISMNDQIWALASGGIGMIKRVRMNGGQVHLMSDNPHVSDYAAGEDELTVIGRVVAVVRRV